MKRWIIRSFFIGVLLLFVVGWGWSYVQITNIVYNNVASGRSERIMISCGRLFFTRLVTEAHSQDAYSYGEEGWSLQRWEYSDSMPRSFGTPNWGSDWLGFAYHRTATEFFGYEGSHTIMSVPFWFPTAISAILLWFAWRKTRPKPKGRAFPVEADLAKGGQG